MGASGLAGDEDIYETPFRRSPCGTLLFHAHTLRLEFANPGALALFRLEEREFGERTLDELSLPETRESLSACCRRVARGVASHETVPCKISRPDGTALRVQFVITALKPPAGPAELLLANVMALPGSPDGENPAGPDFDTLQQFVATAPVSIAMLDCDLKYVVVSGRWVSDHRFEAMPLIGISHYDAFPELPQKWKEEHQRALNGEAIHVEEEPLVRKSGEYKWIRRDITPWRRRDGSIGGIIIFSEDITSRKHIENELLNSESRYRSVIEAASDGFVMADLEGAILAVNNAYVRMSGFSEAELLKMRVTDLEVLESPNEIRHHLNTLVKTGQGRFESAHRKKNGTSYPVEISASYLPSENGAVFAFVRDITERKSTDLKISNYVRQVEQFTEDTLLAFSNMVEQRDPYTAGHEQRVGMLAADIAREMGFSEKRCNDLKLIGHVHDIGKIGIPAEILSKPGRLSDLEYQLVQTHALKGYEILKEVKFTLPIAEIIYQHHERMNGSGYPRKLSGKEILLEARILAIADVVESIISHRPYRPARGIEEALKEIESNAGKLYDSSAVAACLRLFRTKGYIQPSPGL